MQNLSGMKWLKEQIEKLEVTTSKSFKNEIEQIIKIKPEIYNEFKEWTPLKLILLNYTLDVCSTIINKCPFFENKYYIDLFAGSGINKIKDTEDFLIGSSLIAMLGYSDIYNLMIFCEKDPSFYEALNLRLQILKKGKFEIFKGKYEDNLVNILKQVNSKNTYSFFFIDPYSTEFVWDSMKQILKVRSDILLTFMTSEIYRAVHLANSGIGVGQSLTKMFGDESWKTANSDEDLISIYKNNILKERTNAPIKVIKVKSKQFNFYYHIFFITNKTRGENRWLRAIDKAKKEIESHSDIAVKKALDIVKKRQSELSTFLK